MKLFILKKIQILISLKYQSKTNSKLVSVYLLFLFMGRIFISLVVTVVVKWKHIFFYFIYETGIWFICICVK